MLVVTEHLGHCATTSFFLNSLLFICCLNILPDLSSLRLFGFVVNICKSGLSLCVSDADESHRSCSAPLNSISYTLEGELETDLEGELETDLEGELETDLEGELETDLEGEYVSKPVLRLDSECKEDLDVRLEAVLNSESDQQSTSVLSTDVSIEAKLIYLGYSCIYFMMS